MLENLCVNVQTVSEVQKSINRIHINCIFPGPRIAKNKLRFNPEELGRK